MDHEGLQVLASRHGPRRIACVCNRTGGESGSTLEPMVETFRKLYCGKKKDHRRCTKESYWVRTLEATHAQGQAMVGNGGVEEEPKIHNVFVKQQTHSR